VKDQFLLSSVELDSLFKAAEKINAAFSPISESKPSTKEINATESSSVKELKILFANLYALAAAELEMRSKSRNWYLLGSVSYEFEEIASETAETPFSSRDRNGLLNLVNLIIRFFRDDRIPDKKGFFFFLKRITEKNLSNVIRNVYKSEKSLLHYIFSAVARQIHSATRYKRNGDLVVDQDSKNPSSENREATVEEIVTLCSPDLEKSMTPAEVIDLIFDSIGNDRDFISILNISTLRTAVYELVKPRFTPENKDLSDFNPMQECLQKELLNLAVKTVSEIASTYHWRDEGSAEQKELYILVARDLLTETIVHGNRSPVHVIFARHMPGCTRDLYRNKYMGSFQNFWKVTWNCFLKKIRADL